MSRPSIKMVANLAGVSTATVSHVINKTRYVSPELEKRVNDVIENIGFYPSSAARSLVTNKTNIIGVVFSEIGNPFYTAAFKGIEDETLSDKYDIILANTGENELRQTSIINALISRNIDGLILAPSRNSSEAIENLISRKIPLVLFDRRYEKVPSVVINNVDASFQVVNHLISDGHQRIGIIAGNPEIDTSIFRIKGYRKALQLHGINPDSNLIFEGNSLENGGYAGAKHLLSLENPPEAIFSTNNLMTIGVLHYLRDAGLNCPKDVALASFDDHDWADIFSPPLTVIRQPTYNMGKKAAMILKNLMNNIDWANDQEYQTIFSAELVVRASCSVDCQNKFLKIKS